MGTQRLDLADAHLAQGAAARGQPVSRLLLDDGTVSPRTMVGAVAEAARTSKPVAQVLEAEALATPEQIRTAQARHFGAMALDARGSPADPKLATVLPAETCLALGVLPWFRLGDALVIATSRPNDFAAIREMLPPAQENIIMAVATEADIHSEIGRIHGDALARRAECWPKPEDSCRDINSASPVRRAIGIGIAAVGLALLWFFPATFFGVALMLALGSLVVSQGMKLAALLAPPRALSRIETGHTLPSMSLLVPLYREDDIVVPLIARLQRLDYPRTLLDVTLILEAGDDQTRQTLEQTTLPSWMRVIEVPKGPITTKPRAMNYCLPFTRGSIVGIYDAEDAPAPDQLRRIASEFSRAPPEVACLQGILDFYNPHANWLSRCFAVEYATWFRVVLPGLARLGFVIPLGGTTVFFRRAALEHVHGWDAHNVTEDADLGVRLARQGFKTQFVPTVTREEANNRFWPWVKQRSRWLKGYCITWWVHSRRPVQLVRDLGLLRALGVQVLFLTAILQFTLAPVLWSFWLILLGLPHPLDGHLSPPILQTLTAVFLSAEGISLIVGLTAVARTRHTGLMPWVPTLFAYFPLGTLAIYKALWETVTNPFYWDKTQHGKSTPDTTDAEHLPD